MGKGEPCTTWSAGRCPEPNMVQGVGVSPPLPSPKRLRAGRLLGRGDFFGRMEDFEK